MKTYAWIASLALLTLPACGSSGDGTGTGTESSETGTDASADASATDASTSDSGDGDGDSSSGDGDGDGDGDSTTGDGDGDGDSTTGDGDGDGDKACDMCVGGECLDEFEACVADSDCVCWSDCMDLNDDEAACQTQCGDKPESYEAIEVCYFDAINVDGACFEVCSDPCEECFLEACGDEVAACFDDELCGCWSDCFDEDNAMECETLCGAPAPMSWNDLLTCYAMTVAPGGSCDEVCD